MATIKTVSIRLATVLAGSITVILSSLLLATPSAAFAYYGAIPNYSIPSYQACSGRYDSNCLIEVTNYLNGSSYQGYQNNVNSYMYPSQSSYNTANGYANQNQNSYQYPSYNNSVGYNSNFNNTSYAPYNYSNTGSYYQPSYQYSTPSYNYSPSYSYQNGYNYQYSYGYNYSNTQPNQTPIVYNNGYYHY